MRLAGKQVVCFVESEFEDLELWYPVMRLREEGATVHFVGPKANHVYIGKYGVPCEADKAMGEVNPADYAGVLVPGGWAPDKLRRYPEVLSFVVAMHEEKNRLDTFAMRVGCLPPQKILRGVRTTSTPGIKDDMENAGAIWVDEEVVVDGHIVGSRRPPDLPAYAKAFADLLAIQ